MVLAIADGRPARQPINRLARGPHHSRPPYKLTPQQVRDLRDRYPLAYHFRVAWAYLTSWAEQTGCHTTYLHRVATGQLRTDVE